MNSIHTAVLYIILGLLIGLTFSFKSHRRATEAPLQGLVRATYLTEEAP